MRIIRKDSAALTRFIQAKKAADQAIRELKAAEEELVEQLREQHKKSVTLTEGDKVQRATFVQTESTKIDEEGLRKAVGVKIWNAITDRKVNKAKLLEQVGTGTLTEQQVAPFITVVPNKAYLRYSEGQRKDAEEVDDDDE
jgi:hypothetical protein